MKRIRMPLVAVFVVMGCGTGDTGGAADAPPVGDLPADVPADLVPDAAADTPGDRSPDLAPDLAPDPAPDLAADFAPDPAADTTADTAADLASDAPAEVPADLPAEVPADTPADPVADTAQDVPSLPSGCCVENQDCPNGQTCAHGHAGSLPGLGVCVALVMDAGRCWDDENCGPGWECHGAGYCGCMVDCDLAWEGPGICVPQGAECAVVNPAFVEEVCGAASVVVFDGTKCVRTCPGCCGCEGFCDLTFDTVEACEAKCPPKPYCQPWEGDCLDVIPPFPYWVFNGTECEYVDSCDCGNCQKFLSFEACESACNGCIGHSQCGAGEVCLGFQEGPARECGLCDEPEPCHCAIPPWSADRQCDDDYDCRSQMTCGDGCDDCPPCPRCHNGWCAWETFQVVECICTGCA
ncbi:MAG: hypothetical protein FJ087_12245 [Deltaproteobacteria bacterium]|nr:hypothetical protein [Deltaproteobacteria bacterium]